MSKSNITNDLSKARTRADLIQNETQEGKNDHERVGQGLNYILDCIQDNANDIAALEDGGTSGGGNVTVTSYYPSTGEHIADISVGGVSNGIYAPKPGTPNLSSPLKEINNLNRPPSSANKILVSTASGGWEYQDKPTGGGGGGDITNVRYDNEIADLSTAQKVGTLYVSSGNVSSPYSVYAPKGGTVDFNGIQKNYFTNVLHGTTPDTPQGINKGYVADGDYFFYNGNYWYRENVNPTDQQDTWMLIVWFNTNGTIDSMSKVKVFDSSTGGRLNGRDGQEIEWIYMLCDEELSEGTHGTYEAMESFLSNCKGDAIGKTKTGESAPFTQEDVMPDLTGHATLGSYTWTDNPTGISADHKYEYASFRVSGISSTGVRQWGDTGFAAPFVWSKWGDRGMDGDGVEYIFWVSKTGSAPAYTEDPNSDYPPSWNEGSNPDSGQRRFTDAEYIGPDGFSNWVDNPIDMDDDTNYPEGSKEWVSIRKLRRQDDSEEGTWGTFSTPALWTYKARNGVANGYIVDLTNEMLPVGTDETGAIASWSNWSRVQVYHNGLKMTYTSGTPTVGSNNFTYEVDEQNIEWATGAAGNINITTNGADITVGLSNVTGLNEKSIMIPIIVTVPGVEANTTTTINKNLIIQGIATGEAGQTVDMYVDTDSIISSYDGGNVVPSKVNFGVRIGRGDDIATYPAENPGSGSSAWDMGYYFKYTYFVNNSGTSSDRVTSINPVSRPGTDKNTLYYYKVDMYKRTGSDVSNNDKIVDTETIPIIREAAPGIGIDAINYNINAIGTTLTVDPTTGNVTGKLNFKLTKTEGANTTELEDLIYYGDETLKQYKWGDNAYFTVKVGGANAKVSRNGGIFVAEPTAWHNSGDGWDPAINPYTQIIVYTTGGTPLVSASLVVPFIKQGEKGSDAQVQSLGGVVIRYRDWSNLNGDNCGDVGIGVVPSDKDSIVYKDIILYNDNYYYLKPSYAQAPGGLNGDCSVSNVKNNAGTPSTSDNWVKVEPYEDAMFQFLMAKYAYIENLTAKHVIIMGGVKENGVTVQKPIAGITSGTSVPSVIEGYDGLESVRFWAGLTDNNLWNSKFLVTQYGQLKATNADISGTIRANAVYNPVYEVSEDLTIDPSIHGRSFMFIGASDCTITLPLAEEYPGLELQFYAPFFTQAASGLTIRTQPRQLNRNHIYFPEGTTMLNRTLTTNYFKVAAYNNNLITIKSLPLDPYSGNSYNWVVVSGDVSGYPE